MRQAGTVGDGGRSGYGHDGMGFVGREGDIEAHGSLHQRMAGMMLGTNNRTERRDDCIEMSIKEHEALRWTNQSPCITLHEPNLSR